MSFPVGWKIELGSEVPLNWLVSRLEGTNLVVNFINEKHLEYLIKVTGGLSHKLAAFQ